MQRYIEPIDWTPIESDNVVSGYDRQDVFAPLEHSVAYYNHTNVPVTVVGRDGIPFVLPPSGQRHNHLLVQVQYRIAHGTELDPRNMFHQHTLASPQGDALRKAIENMETNTRAGTARTMTVTYTYTRDRLINTGGTLYVSDLDLVISVHTDSIDTWKALHPYSSAASRYQLLEADIDVNQTDRFGYSIRIVSNDGAIGDKYINIAGSVYRVPSIRCQSLPNGIHLCSSGPVINGTRTPYPVTKHYALEEARDELMLFDTPEEAASLGDVVKQRDAEIQQLKHEQKMAEQDYQFKLNQQKYELEEHKRILEQEAADREAMYRQAEHERSMRSMRDKEYYETRSAVRKDTSEFVKYIPVLISAVFSLATLLVKVNQK